MNVSWAISELSEFVSRCHQHDTAYKRTGDSNPTTDAMYDDVITRIPIIEQIAERAWPEWRRHLESEGFGWRYSPLRTISKQLLVILKRKEELEQNLGEQGPSLSVSTMHADVWDASKSLWKNGHFGEAVVAATRSVNASLQAKVGRRDLSEARLISECFSLDPPKPGAPRLRLMANDGSDTYKSIHSGAISFGQGCYKAIRNVLSHEYGERAEPPEGEALHYLAAFSILALWIEKANVEMCAP
jgi:hypothetical protein